MQKASLFDLGSGDSGRMVASRAFQMVTEELSAKFVPLHLSVSHLSRNDALAHMTEIAKVFLWRRQTCYRVGWYILLYSKKFSI